MGAREMRKCCVARLMKEKRDAGNNIRSAVSMKIAVEDSGICNIAARRKRLKVVS